MLGLFRFCIRWLPKRRLLQVNVGRGDVEVHSFHLDADLVLDDVGVPFTTGVIDLHGTCLRLDL